MYHCSCAIDVYAPFTTGESEDPPLLPVDGSCCVLLESLCLRRIEPEEIGELRQIDTFRTAWLFVAAQHRECEHVQRPSLVGIGDTCDDLAQRTRLIQFRLDQVANTSFARLLDDRAALAVADDPISARRGYRETQHPHRVRGHVGCRGRRHWRQWCRR